MGKYKFSYNNRLDRSQSSRRLRRGPAAALLAGTVGSNPARGMKVFLL